MYVDNKHFQWSNDFDVEYVLPNAVDRNSRPHLLEGLFGLLITFYYYVLYAFIIDKSKCNMLHILLGSFNPLSNTNWKSLGSFKKSGILGPWFKC